MIKIADKIRAIMAATGKTQMQLAEELNVSQSTVNRWLGSAEPEGHRRDAINELYETLVQKQHATDEGTEIPVMGFIGAGAEIMPEFEQVPPDGISHVIVPFPLPAEMIAFEVRGDSMLPVYKDGHVIVCYREQKRPIEAFYGEDAAVRTSDGRRFIKTIMRGNPGINLMSWNAAPIENVSLEWIGEIFATLPRNALKSIERKGGIQGRLKLA
ncbi:phage repressor protein C with HTH and peptisase S24 domain [Rhizobium subbaraonis]|uniref:Phage repressor protein C with HTH and peptisase S24 domain n=1 Tax=Rhizobium subbaraonis TaxID=908946 RepID=A0A285UL24_9HYPH|nr:XRE family transcriptional regulator [Rhizobium subbaraonis]SOC42463.1 phage repressor protein C with HTH and peptisase S24 domain [Rhizobium subbaraonis]